MHSSFPRCRLCFAPFLVLRLSIPACVVNNHEFHLRISSPGDVRQSPPSGNQCLANKSRLHRLWGWWQFLSPALRLHLVRPPIITQWQSRSASWAPRCPRATLRTEYIGELLDDSSADEKYSETFPVPTGSGKVTGKAPLGADTWQLHIYQIISRQAHNEVISKTTVWPWNYSAAAGPWRLWRRQLIPAVWDFDQLCLPPVKQPGCLSWKLLRGTRPKRRSQETEMLFLILADTELPHAFARFQMCRDSDIDYPYWGHDTSQILFFKSGKKKKTWGPKVVGYFGSCVQAGYKDILVGA